VFPEALTKFGVGGNHKIGGITLRLKSFGAITGGTFAKIFALMANDINMPPIGVLLIGADFTEIFLNLSGGEYGSLAALGEAGAATTNYGVFVNTLINFLIVASAIFMVIKRMNKLTKREEAAPDAPKAPPRE